MKIVVLFLILSLSYLSSSNMGFAKSPCNSVARATGKKINRKLNSVASKHLAKSDVKVSQEFRFNSWHILQVDPKDADQAFLFYSSSPQKAHSYVTLWAGAAMKTEEKEIYDWVKANAAGIPNELAKCFAWYVTNSRSK